MIRFIISTNFQGMTDSIIGPTLLDICDIYNSPVNVITFVIIFRAIGSIIGCSLGEIILYVTLCVLRNINYYYFLFITAGILLDKFTHYRSYILFAYTFILGVTFALLPHLKYVWLYFAISTLNSFTGNNINVELF